MAEAAHAAPAPRRRRWPWIALAAVAVAAAASAAVLPAVARPAGDPRPRTPKVATAEVLRGDVSETVKASGQFAYDDPRELGTTLAGTVTSVPAAGALLGRGDELFRVDDAPVTLLFGVLPAWRGFGPGMADGRDVHQLEENLRELGYFDDEPDDEFDWRTEQAVRDWQEDLGTQRTGTLIAGSVVFQPGPVRVAVAAVAPGAPADLAVLRVTGDARLATVDLDANLGSLAVPGAAVELTLPGGRRSPATVREVGSVVEKDQGEGKSKLKVPVTVALDDPADAGDLVDVRASVQFARVLAADVLAVPVTALVAGPSGETTVEVVDGSRIRRVPVTLGVFGDGMVEVSGDLEAGARVVVAQ